jgi:hypothetical protein
VSRLAHLWRHHRVLLVAAATALAFTLFFAVRVAVFAIYWSDPAHRDQAVAGWMTPRYIAHSWQVPPSVVADALQLAPARTGRPPTLESIAAARGVAVEDLSAEVQAAIVRYRAANE